MPHKGRRLEHKPTQGRRMFSGCPCLLYIPCFICREQVCLLFPTL